jgi:hypothetical protein
MGEDVERGGAYDAAEVRRLLQALKRVDDDGFMSELKFRPTKQIVMGEVLALITARLKPSYKRECQEKDFPLSSVPNFFSAFSPVGLGRLDL